MSGRQIGRTHIYKYIVRRDNRKQEQARGCLLFFVQKNFSVSTKKRQFYVLHT